MTLGRDIGEGSDNCAQDKAKSIGRSAVAPRHLVGMTLWVLFGVPSVAFGQADNYETEYLKRLKAAQTIQPHGDSPLGEEINLYTGEVSFTHIDIVVEGTGPAIRISRSRSGSGFSPESMDPPPGQHLGDWQFNVPRIATLVAAPRYGTGTPGANWRRTYATDAASLARCANFGPPYVGQSGILLEDWWHGYELVMDDGSRQTLLQRAPGYVAKPNDGLAYPVVTLSNTQMRCLPNTANGQAGDAFQAITPDGTKYKFDWLVGTKAGPVRQDVDGSGVWAVQARMQAAMLVTQVEDRFGNTLTYNYAGNLLQSIVGSDGRHVALSWNGNNIATVTVQPSAPNPRVWTYQYGPDGKLSAVVLPDNSRWTFNLQETGGQGVSLASLGTNSCALRTGPNSVSPGGGVSTITAPSGVTGTFVFQSIWHARSYVASHCADPVSPYELVPPLYSTVTLVERSLSGPGLATTTWTYRYPTANGSTTQDSCAASNTCPDTKYVEVTAPDGTMTRYTASTRWGSQEGKSTQVATYDAVGTLKRSEAMTYVSTTGAPFLTDLGESMLGFQTNMAKIENLSPLIRRTIVQDGRTFTWEIPATCTGLCMDSFGRATTITRGSTSP